MQMGKWEGNCREKNCFVYIWKKSRFQLTDRYGREVGKFISHVSRKGCGRKVSLYRQGKCFWGNEFTRVRVHRPFHSQVTGGRDVCRKGKRS